MFKVSTKGDYGLLFMTGLAEKSREGFVALKTVAQEKNLSLSYLSQIVMPLKQAGLVESKEGINGGYRLAKKPTEITLMDILKVLEGDIAPVRCTQKKSCQCEMQCGVKNAWQDAAIVLAQYLSSRTLADLSQKKSDNSFVMVREPHHDTLTS